MPLLTGFLQIISTILCVALLSLQLASIAGNGVFHVKYSDNSWSDVGVFNQCRVSEPNSDTTCKTCTTMMKAFENDGESNRFCGGAGEPDTTVGDVKSKYRGVQAMAIITFIIAIVHFGATMAFVCDKIATPIPAFVTTLLILVGGITTAALAITTLNSNCTKTFCERAKEGRASSCVASFTVYCEIFSGFVALVGAILLYCSKRKAEKAGSYPIATMPPTAEAGGGGEAYAKI